MVEFQPGVHFTLHFTVFTKRTDLFVLKGQMAEISQFLEVERRSWSNIFESEFQNY